MEDRRLDEDEVDNLYNSLARRAETSADPRFHKQLAAEVKPYVDLKALFVFLETQEVEEVLQVEIIKQYSRLEQNRDLIRIWQESLKDRSLIFDT